MDGSPQGHYRRQSALRASTLQGNTHIARRDRIQLFNPASLSFQLADMAGSGEHCGCDADTRGYQGDPRTCANTGTQGARSLR